VSVKDTPDAAGYTLVEVMMVTAVMAIIAGVAVPPIAAGMRRYALNNAAQQVASAIRSARYTAVAKNTDVRVRFNCPADNQYRVVEVTGVTAIDTNADRCSTASYPYPDADLTALPNVDGPVLVLPSGTELGDVDNLHIDTEGRVSPLTGCPTCATTTGTVAIALENGVESQTITVGLNGQIQVETAVAIE
jgi:prepilin-type N-terminal cleavage/methylation domain-containing protein